MSEKNTEGRFIRPTREMRRARLRKAYDELSASWRRDRRTQESLTKLGLEVKGPRLGRKPPFSVFARCIPEGEDPVQVVRESPPADFLEYARECEYRWRGDVPNRPGVDPMSGNVRTVDIGENPFEKTESDGERSVTTGRGVTTIDIAGGDED